MSSEKLDALYTNVMQIIEAGSMDQAVEMIRGTEDMDTQLVLLSRLARELDLNINRARERAFESANSLIGGDSSIRAGGAIFALALVSASTSAGALYRAFDLSSVENSEAKFELTNVLKLGRDLENELAKLSRTPRLEPELENGLARCVSLVTSIRRVLEIAST